MKAFLKFKYLFLLIFICSGTSLLAQKKKSSGKQSASTSKPIEKSPSKSKKGFDYRKIEAGANLHLYAYPLDGNNGRDINPAVSIMAGYKITPKVVLGVKIGSQFRTNYSSYEGGVFGRYYFDKPFIGAGINFGSSAYSGGVAYINDPYYYDDYRYGTYSYGYFSVEGGYRFDVTNHIAIEPAIDIDLPLTPAGQKIWFGIRVGAVYRF